MPLTALALSRVAPRETTYKLADGGGLYLLVSPKGSRLWRFDYRFAGRRKTLALGGYPDVGLAQARVARDDAKRRLLAQVDPGAERQAQKIAQKIAAIHTFDAVADAYTAKRTAEGINAVTLQKDREKLAVARAAFGSRPVSEITPQEVLVAARGIERRGKDARRFRSTVSRVFRFAIAGQLADRDPARDIADALIKRKAKHHASPKDPLKIGALVRTVEGYDGEAVTRCAIRLAILTFVRPGELRKAEWSEVDRPAATWRIPGSKMKHVRRGREVMGHDHIVPLSTQALGVLDELWSLTGAGKHLFPSTLGGGRVMSDNTVNAALRRMGYGSDEIVGHGFRSMASTALNESGRFEPDWVERQLAHVEGNTSRGAYNAALYLPQRTAMMQWYADWLDAQKTVSTLMG